MPKQGRLVDREGPHTAVVAEQCATISPSPPSCGDPTTSFHLLRPASAVVPRRPETSQACQRRGTSQNIKLITVLPAQRIKYSLPCAGVDYTLWTNMLCVQRRSSVRRPESMSVAPQYSTNYRVTGPCRKISAEFVETSAMHRANPPVKQYLLLPSSQSPTLLPMGLLCPIAGTWVGDWHSVFHPPVGRAQCTSRAPCCSEILRLICLVPRGDQFPLVTSRRLRRESCLMRGYCTGRQDLRTRLAFRRS